MRAMMEEEEIRDIKAMAVKHGLPEYRFIALLLSIGVAGYMKQERDLRGLREAQVARREETPKAGA